MIKITIPNPQVRELKGISKVTQKPYHLRMQTAYAFTVSKEGEVAPFPDKFEIMLDADQAPYAAGDFQLSPSAVYVSREGRLEMSPRLVPLRKTATA